VSRLRNFFSSLATGVGNEMARNEEIQRQMTVQEALEKRRLELQQAAADRAREQGIQDRNAEFQAGGPTLGYDAKGKPGLMQRALEIDPVTKAVRGSSTRVGDVPVTVQARGQQKTARGTVTGVYMTDGSFIPDGDPLPPGAGQGSGGGNGGRGRYDVRTIDGRVKRVNLDDPTDIVDYGPAGSGSAGGAGRKTPATPKLTPDQRTKYIKEIDAAKSVDEVRAVADGLGIDTSRIDSSYEGASEKDYLTALRGAVRTGVKEYGAPAAPKADAGRTYPTPTPAAFAELGSNPSPADIAEFEQVFGPGSASRRGR